MQEDLHKLWQNYKRDVLTKLKKHVDKDQAKGLEKLFDKNLGRSFDDWNKKVKQVNEIVKKEQKIAKKLHTDIKDYKWSLDKVVGGGALQIELDELLDRLDKEVKRRGDFLEKLQKMKKKEKM